MTDLSSYLDDRRKMIDRCLDAVLPAETDPPLVLHKAMRYCVFSGGKRLRPILCLAAAEAVGGDPDVACSAAAAVEILHTYTLVHDDLPCMDDDDVRRGKPTVHVAFGEATAVLTGDALQALAYEVTTRTAVPARYPPRQLVLELAQAAGSRGVVGGQVEDLAMKGKTPEAEAIASIHRHKTADLFRAALRMGAVAGDADEAQLYRLSDYGLKLGLAFQVADDLLDAERHDPASCLSVYEPDEAQRYATRLMEEAIAAIDSDDLGHRDALIAIARFAVQRKY